MSKKLLPFAAPPAQCRKCGWRQYPPASEVFEPQYHHSQEKGEYLEWRCGNCGYSYETLPMDAPLSSSGDTPRG